MHEVSQSQHHFHVKDGVQIPSLVISSESDYKKLRPIHPQPDGTFPAGARLATSVSR